MIYPKMRQDASSHVDRRRPHRNAKAIAGRAGKKRRPPTGASTRLVNYRKELGHSKMTMIAKSAVPAERLDNNAIKGPAKSGPLTASPRPAPFVEAPASPTALLLIADGVKREQLGAVLSQDGLRSVSERDDAAALDRVAREPDIGAVIIDADGFGAKISAVVDALRKRSASPLPAILLSREPSFDMLQEVARTGPVDILPQTPDADALLASTRSAFAWRRPARRPDESSNNVFNMLAQIEARLGALAPQDAPTRKAPSAQPPMRRIDQNAVKALIRVYAAQRDILGTDLIDGAAWVMLLDLMLMHIERKPLAVTALCVGSGIPVTTALRRLDELIAKRFVEKLADPSDRRRTLVSITPKGVECVSAIVEGIEKELAFLIAG